MKTLVFLFSMVMMASTPGQGDYVSSCSVGLPTEIMLDCIVAEGAAQTPESSTTFFAEDIFNVTERLQAWVDRQMQRGNMRTDEETGEPSGVAQQMDKR